MIDITKYKQHIYEVVGAIHEVHKELGPGLNENCYQEGLQMELEEQGNVVLVVHVVVNIKK